MKEIQINESLSLLEDFSPDIIDKLKDEYPNLTDTFRTGIMLGDDDMKGKKEEIELRVEIIKSSLEVIISKCDSFIPKLKIRLKRLNNIQLISQIIIAISGASLLTILSSEISKSINYVVGALALIGSLLTIYVQGKSISINPNSSSLFNVYEDLVNLHINAEQKLSDLTIYSSISDGLADKKLPEILSSSNDLCVEIRKLIRKI